MHPQTKKAFIGGACALAMACLVRQFIRWSRRFDYRDKAAIVTGGSRGLGLVLARKLVAAGAKVAICARTAEDVEAAAKELDEEGAYVFGAACDIRDFEQVTSFVRQVESRWSRHRIRL